MEGLIIANIKIKNRVTEKINKAKKIVGEQNQRKKKRVGLEVEIMQKAA